MAYVSYLDKFLNKTSKKLSVSKLLSSMQIGNQGANLLLNRICDMAVDIRSLAIYIDVGTVVTLVGCNCSVAD